jgi:hypothetical protein
MEHDEKAGLTQSLGTPPPVCKDANHVEGARLTSPGAVKATLDGDRRDGATCR